MKAYKPGITVKDNNGKNIDAETTHQELLKIRTNHGNKLTSKILLKESKNSDSLLHNYFIWDNNVAGEKYRREQASRLMTGIIEIEVSYGTEKIEKNAWIGIEMGINSTEHASTRNYQPFEFVINDPVMVRNHLDKIKNMIKNHIESYILISEDANINVNNFKTELSNFISSLIKEKIH
jgi:hypothetical protein